MAVEFKIAIILSLIVGLIALIISMFDKATSINNAAAKGDFEKVTKILTDNPDLANARGIIFGWTPLMMASYYGRKNIAELLLEKGAKPNAKTIYGVTALHWTATAEIAELLINKGANVNAKDKDGKTPLAYMNKNKRLDLAYFLRQHGGQA